MKSYREDAELEAALGKNLVILSYYIQDLLQIFNISGNVMKGSLKGSHDEIEKFDDIPEKGHSTELLVVHQIVRIGPVDPTGHEGPVEPGPVLRERLWDHRHAWNQTVFVVLFSTASQGQASAE